MCGGILTAFSLQHRSWVFALNYHLGRITSYTFMGMLVGFFMEKRSLFDVGQSYWHVILISLTSISMLFMTAHLWGFEHARYALEKLGAPIWRVIQPWVAQLKISRPHHAFIGGMAWGWIPCGLVYGALMGSIGQGNALLSGLSMLAFGFGTLPHLFAFSLLGQKLHVLRNPTIKKLGAAFLAVYALYFWWISIII